MSDYWPDGLSVRDTQSPMEILKAAQQDWEQQSEGLLVLELRPAEAKPEYSRTRVEARNKHDGRSAVLFEVVHQPDAPYPATIQLATQKLPALLQSTRYEPGVGDMLDAVTARSVAKDWVADTPEEFRTMLKRVINMGSVKSEILALLTTVEAGHSNGGADDSRNE